MPHEGEDRPGLDEPLLGAEDLVLAHGYGTRFVRTPAQTEKSFLVLFFKKEPLSSTWDYITRISP
jgi:hypothetical protein